MGFVKCFDVASMVVDEATKQFSPLWVLDIEKYKILEQYCSVIDSLAKEFDGESFEISVDDIKMTIEIIVEYPDMTIRDKSHPFFSLVQHAIEFGFTTNKDGKLSMKIVFPSIWTKV